jgi:hypothetical protein
VSAVFGFKEWLGLAAESDAERKVKSKAKNKAKNMKW